MAKIKLAADLNLDLDLLLRTRLLIQGGSGSGKSYLLRRLAEQLFGHVPVIIIDPEGEFASLREKYGYVLVGPGGETPADVRSAALVAHKLLELRASAVCDIYELPPAKRHEWVKLFVDALIDAPKNLWQPVVVIVDEAHMFAPEKNAGESEASDSIISLASRGRKRGFCLVAATQRLGKLRKDVAAELQNVLIGLTSIDIDRKRAVEAMGVVEKKEVAEFSHQLKTLSEGKFWAFGRALSLDRKLVQILGVETSHPKAGSSKHAAAAPPTPEKVRALLPKLADLPQQAEAKALTEKELRQQVGKHAAENLQLRKELERVKFSLENPPMGKAGQNFSPKTVEILTDADRAKLQGLSDQLKDAQLYGSVITSSVERLKSDVEVALVEAVQKIQAAVGKQTEELARRLETAGIQKVVQKLDRVSAPLAGGVAMSAGGGKAAPHFQPAARFTPSRNPGRPVVSKPVADGEVTGVGQKILNALAELELLGAETPERELVAFLSGYSNLTSKGFVNGLGSLRSAALVDYPSQGTVALTDGGRQAASYPDAPRSSAEVQQRVIGLLGGASARILEPLIAAYPTAMPREDVAAAANYGNVTSKGFANAIGRLRTLGFVRYPDRGTIAAAPVLFLGGAMKKKSAASRSYGVPQGFACDCQCCVSERQHHAPTPSGYHYCARCGHMYLNTLRGRPDDANQGCTKCGSTGQWADTRPDLPAFDRPPAGPTCPFPNHVWADEFSDGDTCWCGRWYLTQDSNGSHKITEAP